MNKSRLYVLVLAGAAVVALGGVAYADHAWGFYHWARTANPFTLKLADNVSPAWDAHLVAASGDWSQSDTLDTAIVPGRTRPQTCKPTAGRVEVCDAKYGNNGWLGIAQIWITGGTHISQGVVKLNDTYFNMPMYNTPAWRQYVVCQEIGHTFGLDHQDETSGNSNLGSCMDYTNDPGRDDGGGNNLHPNTHDYEELASIYTHLDGVTTISSVTAAKAATAMVIDGSNDARESSEWGRTVRRDSRGRPSLYEREINHGGRDKIYTFVLWAE